MIKAIAIDDEPLALKVISNFCERIDFIKLDNTFSKPNEGLDYLGKYPIDLLFLDINMPSINGIELCKNLKQNSMIIFTTAYSEYAVDGFNLNAIDYLLKPFSYIRFLNACNKANDFFNLQSQTENSNISAQHIFVRADHKLVKITTANILYIEGLDDYIKIYLDNNQKPITSRMPLKAIIEKLSSKEFLRVHRSFIVPISKIKNVKGKTIYLEGKEIPIGSSFEEGVLKTLNNK
jgi:DNA-binding LytR/AlgR family response regulator